MSTLKQKELIQSLNDAWFEINVNNDQIINPFDRLMVDTENPEEFYKRFTSLIVNPEYFYFMCKHILNIDLLPVQALMLKELWTHKFPMLIASRGFGKAAPLSEPILTSNGWQTMGDVNIGTMIYGRDGKLHKVTQIHPQGKKQVCRLTFMDGRIADCCEDHLWVVKNQKKEKIVTAKEIIDSGVSYPKHKNGGRVYKYQVPLCDEIAFSKKQLPIDPYILGCLLGDGCTTTLTPKIASDDEFIINEFRKKLPEFKIEKDPTNNNYTIVDTNKDFVERSHHSSGKKFLQRSGNRLTALIKELKINVKCYDKFIPEIYKYSNIEDRYELIKGLMDTDGSINRNGGIEFTNTSEKLVDDLIEVLRSLGISCKKTIDDRSDQKMTLPQGTVINRKPYFRVFVNTSKQIFKLPRKANRKKKTSTNREKYNSIVKAEYLDEYTEMQCISVDSPDNTYITKDYIVTHNTFMLSLYCMLRAALMPNRKIVVVGAAFRQSKFLYDYMLNIWNNAPILRDMCDENSGPRKETDMCRMTINGSTITALPIGDGQKIRGQRANDIISDEFASMSREIFENVIAGFAAVSASPVENVKEIAKQELAKELNVTLPKKDEVESLQSVSNQIVISGTAYYDFNHFAEYWKRWKKIIESKGDMNYLSNEVFGGEEVPESFDWTDYSIIRIPVDLIPKGFMDEGQIARSKATVHNGIYLMEFGACQHPQTPIITQEGIKPIIDVNIGDKVLTHKGRFKSVLKKTFRPYHGQVLKIKSYGYYKPLIFTVDHPFWKNKDVFEELREVDELYLSSVNELSDKTELICTEICNNFVERENYIYPRSSQSLVTNEQRIDIINRYKNGETAKKLAECFGLTASGIYQIVHDKRKPKNSLNSIIKLDLDFGKVIGYYASEGSIGSNGKTCEFALDGHVNTKLEEYVEELSSSIYRSTGISPKYYKKKNNTVSINVNSRVFSDVIKYLCPGDCYTKLIKHDILFSNRDFLKGFIIGMWNGDGHIRDDLATIQLTNKNLINQIKMSLSYFGINSSFLKPKRKKTEKIKGKMVNQSNAWKLNVSGEDFIKFMSIFYNIQINTKIRKNKIRFDKSCIYDFKSRELIDYNGFVYNLEVDEDHSYSTPNATTHNCFAKDSQGFFKRSLIESCVGTQQKPINLPSGDVWFDPLLYGYKDRKYVMAVDPASEVDNFSIIILEVHPDHRRIVYCWTHNRQEHRERLKKGLTKEDNFFNHCARKIRDLMRVFPIVHIAMDAQGGGLPVSEALQDKEKLLAGERRILPIIDQDNPKDTDDEEGLHILELCQNAKYEWYAEANHGMRKDFEDKTLLFPRFDPVTIELSIQQDKSNNRVYDTLEDCVMEIEELKNELSLIEITKKPSGRDHWDTPEVKIGVGKKERMRKDRYSALMMGNMAARSMNFYEQQKQYNTYGGFAVVNTKNKRPTGPACDGPAWFTNKMNGWYS